MFILITDIFTATVKHPHHIRDGGGVETAQIQRYQRAATGKHTAHIRDGGGIETAQIQ